MQSIRRGRARANRTQYRSKQSCSHDTYHTSDTRCPILKEATGGCKTAFSKQQLRKATNDKVPCCETTSMCFRISLMACQHSLMVSCLSQAQAKTFRRQTLNIPKRYSSFLLSVLMHHYNPSTEKVPLHLHSELLTLFIFQRNKSGKGQVKESTGTVLQARSHSRLKVEPATSLFAECSVISTLQYATLSHDFTHFRF